MKKFYKRVGISIGILVALGIVLVLIGWASGAHGVIAFTKNGGFKILEKDERYQYDNIALEAFDTIDIDVDNANIVIEENTDGRYGISIDVPGDESTFKWSDKDGKLQINDSGSDIRFTLQLFSWETRGEGDIIIYVPEGTDWGDIKIVNNVGNITLKDLKKVDNLNVKAEVGDVDIIYGEYSSMEFDAAVGDIDMKNTTVTEKLTIKADVGDINIEGTLKCDTDIDSDVGDVEVTLKEDALYTYNFETNIGDVDASAFGIGHSSGKTEINGTEDGDGEKYVIDIKTDVGDITVERK